MPLDEEVEDENEEGIKICNYKMLLKKSKEAERRIDDYRSSLINYIYLCGECNGFKTKCLGYDPNKENAIPL
ncbi:MAG: hypothetical protein IB618_04200 [Candidatus Pacearchaeota archaeon]|nr:MAG: hypothetical protein IB618_04200 [Candidatus Pacearchaeota archaeon]